MSNILIRIKRAVLTRRIGFTNKARAEMKADGLTEDDVVEAILNAVAIYNTVRSRSPLREHSRERLYVILGTNLRGLPIYTKGKLVSKAGVETYYFLISSKRSL